MSSTIKTTLCRLALASMAALALPAGVQANELDAEIKMACNKKWPNDFTMQEYCVNQQWEGVSNTNAWSREYGLVAGKPTSEHAVTIAIHCFDKWPEDYVMLAYCLQQQEMAAKALGKL